MKKIIFPLIAVAFMACKNETKQPSLEEETEEIVTKISEELDEEMILTGLNNIVPDEVDEGEMLLGEIDRSGLQLPQFKSWYDEGYNGHEFDAATTEEIAKLLEGVDIKVFMGSWCEDSQREVPALLRILDEADFDVSKVAMVAMTHEKDTPQGFEEALNIEYVPTFIFSKDGKEMNRFVEYAQETLEKDILNILKGVPYKHAYQD